MPPDRRVPIIKIIGRGESPRTESSESKWLGGSVLTPNMDVLARVLADERKAQLRKVDRQAWMREESGSEFSDRPFRPAGLIVAILALVVVGQLVLM